MGIVRGLKAEFAIIEGAKNSVKNRHNKAAELLHLVVDIGVELRLVLRSGDSTSGTRFCK